MAMWLKLNILWEKDLKQVDRLSNMFDDQEGGMLDYYDLTTQRGRKGKKKQVKNEERNKQKIFELTDITIPDPISVKDLSNEQITYQKRRYRLC